MIGDGAESLRIVRLELSIVGKDFREYANSSGESPVANY